MNQNDRTGSRSDGGVQKSTPPYAGSFSSPFENFVDQVVPILQRRGLFREEYTGTTLLDHLGLPRPGRGG